MRTAPAWVVAFVMLVGCGGAPGAIPDDGLPAHAFWCDDAHSTWCPVGATCLPSGACWDAETANTYEDGGCNAVACEALSREATATGTDNDCLELCAAWCMSACVGDQGSIGLDQQQMTAEGCSLSACVF